MPARAHVRPVVFVVALLSAAAVGIATALSGQLTPVGAAAISGAGFLIGWSATYIVTEGSGRGFALLVLVFATAGGVVAVLACQAAAPVTGVIGFTGGCGPFQVFAQNRWYPYGASIRTAPNVKSKQIANKDPNQSIAVNGWVHTQRAYKHNDPPFNNDVWYHLADGAGWVSFAGVRRLPVSRDPTGHADGGPPAPMASRCQGSSL